MQRQTFIKSLIALGAIALLPTIKVYPTSFKMKIEDCIYADHDKLWNYISKRLGPHVNAVRSGYEGNDFANNMITIKAV